MNPLQAYQPWKHYPLRLLCDHPGKIPGLDAVGCATCQAWYIALSVDSWNPALIERMTPPARVATSLKKGDRVRLPDGKLGRVLKIHEPSSFHINPESLVEVVLGNATAGRLKFYRPDELELIEESHAS